MLKNMLLPILGAGMMVSAAAWGQTVHLDNDLSDLAAPDNLGGGQWSAHRGTHPTNWAIWDTDPDGTTANTSFWVKGGSFERMATDSWGALAAVPTNAEPLVWEFRMYDFMDESGPTGVPGAYGEIRHLTPGTILFAAGIFDNPQFYRVRMYPTHGWINLSVPRSEGWVTFKLVIRADTFDVYVNDVLDPNATNLPWGGGGNFTAVRMGGGFSYNTTAVLLDDIYLANDPAYAPAVTITQQPGSEHTSKGAIRDFGESVTFNVVAEGDALPLTYQWHRDGEPLTNDARVSGADTASLTITNLDGPDSGGYSVTVTDANDRSTASTSVTLTALYEHEVIVDSADLPLEAIVGTWAENAGSGWFGAYYAGQVAADQPERTVTFQPEITETGYYDIYTWFQPSFPNGNRTKEAPYKVTHADGEDTVFMNQQVPDIQEFWHYVGTFRFEVGTTGKVVISNHILGPGGADAAGLVFADVVRFIPGEAPGSDVAPTVNITRGAGADVELTIVGTPSTTYAVEASDDLVNWTSLGTSATNAEGVGDFTDAGATSSFSRRFYRVTEQ